MKLDSIASGKRKPVNLSIDTGVVAAAREAGINLSQVSEQAIRDAAKAERDRQWKEANREAMEGWNDWLETNGLPYSELRLW
jgi:antitoxin CcdA